jgi:hypothetical protein
MNRNVVPDEIAGDASSQWLSITGEALQLDLEPGYLGPPTIVTRAGQTINNAQETVSTSTPLSASTN